MANRQRIRCITVFFLFMMMLVVVGCSKEAGSMEEKQEAVQEQQPGADEQPKASLAQPAQKTFKIAYFSEEQFMREYGALLQRFKPDLNIKVIPMIKVENGKSVIVNNIPVMRDTNELMAEKPDLVYGSNVIKELSAAGRLIDLDFFLKQDNMDMSMFAAKALEAIKEVGGGRLTALAPGFQANALYYNKTLFDQVQLPYPQGHMDWRMLLQLSQQIASKKTDTELYGLQFYLGPEHLAQQYLRGIGVNAFSVDGRTAQHNSEPYRSAVSDAVFAFRTGAFYLAPEERLPAVKNKLEGLLRNKFIGGEAAMMIAHPGLMQDVLEAFSLGAPKFEWDLVGEPRGGDGVSVGEMFGIAADSPHAQEAWDILKWLTGAEMAKELAKTKPHMLSLRVDAEQTRADRSLAAFYEHKGVSSTLPNNNYSQEQRRQISIEVNQHLRDIIYEKLTVDEGLLRLQQQVQQIIAKP